MTQTPVLSIIGAPKTHFSEKIIIIICTLALQTLGSRFERRVHSTEQNCSQSGCQRPPDSTDALCATFSACKTGHLCAGNTGSGGKLHAGAVNV